MKDLSVSYFKARISACLREVQEGETIVITEHRRPIAEVRAYNVDEKLVRRSKTPFTLSDSKPAVPSPGVWERLVGLA